MDDVLKTLIAEAAGEDDEGMYAVASTFVNRAKRRGKSLHEVVNENRVNKKGVRVWQYSGRSRQDLDRFIAKQGPEVLQRARRALERAQQNPMTGLDHYLTTPLYNKIRNTPGADPAHWSQTMGGLRTIGGHTFMDSRQKPGGSTMPRSKTPRPQSAVPKTFLTSPVEQRIHQMNQFMQAMGFGGMQSTELEQVLASAEPPSPLPGVTTAKTPAAPGALPGLGALSGRMS